MAQDVDSLVPLVFWAKQCGGARGGGGWGGLGGVGGETPRDEWKCEIRMLVHFSLHAVFPGLGSNQFAGFPAAACHLFFSHLFDLFAAEPAFFFSKKHTFICLLSEVRLSLMALTESSLVCAPSEGVGWGGGRWTNGTRWEDWPFLDEAN